MIMKSGNKWTGERLETFIYDENTIEHLHRYAIALSLVKGKRVLDIACGEGYGSNILAGHADSVVGVDISLTTIATAKKKYQKENLLFLEGSADKIPVPDKSLDVVVSFETLEHHDKHNEMLSEIKRVLKDDGMLIMSTPDKENYSDKIKFKNEHHVKELYKSEFKSLINRHFSFATFLYQRSDFYSLVVPEETRAQFIMHDGNYKSINLDTALSHVYVIAIASDKGFVFEQASVFNDANIYKAILQKSADIVRDSTSFRVGEFLLRPFRLIKRKFFLR